MAEWFSADCSAHACIEVQAAANAVLIRAAADPERPIAATRAEFTAFVAGCKAGVFDHLTIRRETRTRTGWSPSSNR